MFAGSLNISILLRLFAAVKRSAKSALASHTVPVPAVPESVAWQLLHARIAMILSCRLVVRCSHHRPADLPWAYIAYNLALHTNAVLVSYSASSSMPSKSYDHRAASCSFLSWTIAASLRKDTLHMNIQRQLNCYSWTGSRLHLLDHSSVL